MTEMHSTISQIAERNTRVVTAILGNEYYQKSLYDDLAVDEVAEANQALADYMYGNDVATLLRRGSIDLLTDMYHSRVNGIITHESTLEGMDMKRLGIVVIRPEVIDCSDQCVDLLEDKNMDVIYRKRLEVSFDQYWGLYHHGYTQTQRRIFLPGPLTTWA